MPSPESVLYTPKTYFTHRKPGEGRTLHTLGFSQPHPESRTLHTGLAIQNRTLPTETRTSHTRIRTLPTESRTLHTEPFDQSPATSQRNTPPRCLKLLKRSKTNKTPLSTVHRFAAPFGNG